MRGQTARKSVCACTALYRTKFKPRGSKADLVGPAQLAVVTLELLHPFTFLAGQPGAITGIDLGLAHPVAQRLGADAQLLGHPAHRAVALTLFGGRLEDEADRSLPQLWWIPPLDLAPAGWW
jgi:ABC-type amino acid transport substrate-binding protein